MSRIFRAFRCRICSTVSKGDLEPTLATSIGLAFCPGCKKKAPVTDLGPAEPTTSPLRAVARTSDPATSHEAARSVTGIRESQKHVLSVLKEHPEGLIDEELVRAVRSKVPMSISGVRTRRAELVEMGLVRDSGSVRLTENKRRSIVWRAA